MEKFKAPALAKGLDILDLIRNHGPLSFNEIQKLTDDNPASLSRYLHTLLAKDYLYKNGHQKYALGIKLMGLRDPKSLWPKLIDISAPLMSEINLRYDITVLLIAYAGEHYHVLSKKIAEDNIGMMSNKSIRPNTLESLWSNKLYQGPSSNLKYQLADNSPKHFDPIQLHAHAQDHGYIKHLDCKTNIIRFGFPIYFNNNVIASICVGSFGQVIDDLQFEELILTITAQIKELEKTL